MAKPTTTDLYRAHAPWALRVAFLLTGDEQAAQDLTHDAFVRVLGRPRASRDIHDFKPFLRTTLINLSRSRLRRLQLERNQAAEKRLEPPIDLDAARRDETRRALLSLPPRQRAAVVLRYFEDLSEADTAAAMDLTLPAVKSLTQRAMKRLRKELEGDPND